MIYIAPGTRQITEELSLKDFHWELVYIGLNLKTGAPEAEIEMWEIHHVHRRKFEFIAPAEYNQNTLIAACEEQLLQMPQFEGSTVS